MNEREFLPIPRAFCWTRFGTEAGEPIEAILERKNREREQSDGVFFWGIGNSVAPGLVALLGESQAPAVLFSPMRSKPRAIDVAPTSIVRWAAGETLLGEPYALPATARVTSRAGDQSHRPHYALVCHADRPLELGNNGVVHVSQLRNLLSENPIGASQVTAVVKTVRAPARGTPYVVAFRAVLVPPYFVRLREADVGVDELAA